tara:strand:- start:293 stop:592 length:300 start_codon:yes stop_codon:yes gene_type:complete
MDEMDFDFRDQIQQTDWYPLEVHHKNNALFVVSPQLDLAVVAKAVSVDDKKQVESWISNKLIYRTDPEFAEFHRKDQYKVFANFVIVSPYVFIQLFSLE